MRASRRQALLALLPAPFLICRAQASPPVLRIGTLRFGTVSWELDTIARHKLADAEGVRIEVVEFASAEATRVALLAGTVDMMVGDWLFVSRQRAEGMPLAFLPFSTSIAALMLGPGSPVATLGELRGRRIGVSGGPLDKAWLLLLSHGRRQGIDLAAEAQPVFGAPPLLGETLRRGGLDAALLYWNFAARAEAEGMRKFLAMEAVEMALGASAPVAMIGAVFSTQWAKAHPAALAGYRRASAAAKTILAESDAEWDALRPLMRAESEAVFLRLRDRFRAGIPRRPVAEEEADAARLYAVLAREGGARLLGPAPALVPGTFWRGLA